MMGPIVFHVTQLVKQDVRLAYALMSAMPIQDLAMRAAFSRGLLHGMDHAREVEAARIYRRAREAGCSIAHAAMLLQAPDVDLDAFLAWKYCGNFFFAQDAQEI